MRLSRTRLRCLARGTGPCWGQRWGQWLTMVQMLALLLAVALPRPAEAVITITITRGGEGAQPVAVVPFVAPARDAASVGLVGRF